MDFALRLHPRARAAGIVCALLGGLIPAAVTSVSADILVVEDGDNLEFIFTQPIVFQATQSAIVTSAALVLKDAFATPVATLLSAFEGGLFMTFADGTRFDVFNESTILPNGLTPGQAMSVTGTVFSNTLASPPPWPRPVRPTAWDMVIPFSAFGRTATVAPGETITLSAGSLTFLGNPDHLNFELLEAGQIALAVGELTGYTSAGAALSSAVNTQLIPEPASLLLVLAALAAICAHRAAQTHWLANARMKQGQWPCSENT